MPGEREHVQIQISSMADSDQIRLMRENRNLTRTQLASRAACSETTIRMIETDDGYSLRRSTAVSIFQAFNATHPLSAQESKVFLRRFKLEGITSVVTAIVDSHRRSESEIDRFCLHLGDDAANEVLACLNRAIETALVARLGSRKASPDDAKPFDISLASPPVDRDGMTEQTITHFDRVKDTRDASFAKPKDRATPIRRKKGA